MRATPLEVFAVVVDRERGTVITAGTAEECRTHAATMNREYQTSAYVVEQWKDTR